MSYYDRYRPNVSTIDLISGAREMDYIAVVPTLSEVVVRLQQDVSLSETRRRDLVSGILRMSVITGVDPRSTPASLRAMRPFITAVRPAKFDLTPKTWANLRSNRRRRRASR